jgi:hypothetical protein
MRLEYKSYIRSSRWKRRRKKFLKYVGSGCEVCTAKGTQVHHLSYDRLGSEPDSDLVLLCGVCHQIAHEPPGLHPDAISKIFEARIGGRKLWVTQTIFNRCERCGGVVSGSGFLWQVDGEQYCPSCVPKDAFLRSESRPKAGGVLPPVTRERVEIQLEPPAKVVAKPRRRKAPKDSDPEIWEAENGKLLEELKTTQILREYMQQPRRRCKV